MLHVLGAQHAVERRLRRDVLAAVGEPRHDLLRRLVAELRAGRDRDDLAALGAPRACSPAPGSDRGDRRRRRRPTARRCAQSGRAPRMRASGEHRRRPPRRRARGSFVVLRLRVVVLVPPDRLGFFFQHEQRGGLGERLVLARGARARASRIRGAPRCSPPCGRALLGPRSAATAACVTCLRHSTSCASCTPLRRSSSPSSASGTAAASSTSASFSSAVQSCGRRAVGVGAFCLSRRRAIVRPTVAAPLNQRDNVDWRDARPQPTARWRSSGSGRTVRSTIRFRNPSE